MSPVWSRRSRSLALSLVSMVVAGCDLAADGAADPEGLRERVAELRRRTPARTPTEEVIAAEADTSGWRAAELTQTLTCRGAGELRVRLNPVAATLTVSLRSEITPTPGAASTIIGLALGGAPMEVVAGEPGPRAGARTLTVRIPATARADRALTGALRVTTADGASSWELAAALPTRAVALAHVAWERAGAEVEQLDELIREFGWLVDEVARAPRTDPRAGTEVRAAVAQLTARRAQLAVPAPAWPTLTLACPADAVAAR